MSFYEDDNCQGPKLTVGAPICDGPIKPDEDCSTAFDNSGGVWGTSWSSGIYTYHGDSWIGKTFATKPDIRCLTFHIWRPSSTWQLWNVHHVLVEERNNLESGWIPFNNLPLMETDIDGETMIRLYDPPPVYSIRVRNMDE